MMKSCQKINLQEPQRNRNATVNFVNLIRTSTVPSMIILPKTMLCTPSMIRIGLNRIHIPIMLFLSTGAIAVLSKTK